jgi:S-formylglutathione hydrolase FrmB
MIDNILFRISFLFVLSHALLISTLSASFHHDTTLLINHTKVDIRFPEKEIRGSILMLPGWNFSRTKTCENSTFCTRALEEGFVLIAPEMGKSLYASTVYPATRRDWAVFPQLRFITDTLQPVVREKFNLLREGQNNFIYGISTGARGGALVAENTGKLYIGAALLSGDYDQRLDSTDNLMKGFYGSMNKFRERWEGADNPWMNASKIKCQVFLGHGKNDKVVPFVQSKNFFSRLVKVGVPAVFSQKEGEGHNFNFWGSETADVLQFFNKLIQP